MCTFAVDNGLKMEVFLFIFITVYVFGIMIVTNAAKEHECDMFLTVLASIILSPIGGLLYVLCFPYKRK